MENGEVDRKIRGNKPWSGGDIKLRPEKGRRNQEWEELGEENPAREDCRYKVLGRGGHSLLEAK